MSWIEMRLEELKKADKSTLRKFGLVIAIPIALIGTILLWKGRPAAIYIILLAGLFALLGLTLPRLLRLVYIGWMSVARYLSLIMTFVILTVFFVLVITPVAFIMRVFGKDLLSKKFPGNEDTYWVNANSYLDDIDRYSKPF